MARKLLHESTATPLTHTDGVFEATFLTPGTGSSGVYGEAMLAEFGPKAFPAGSKMFFNHPSEESPTRDPRDQWGFLAEDAHAAEDGSLKGQIKVLKHWREVVESLAEEGQASLSIWAMGETDEDNTVVGLFPHATNGVDMVAYPGRPGSAITTKMYESARAASNEPHVEASAENAKDKDKNMEEKLDALIALFSTFMTESKALAAANVQAEADADAIETATKAAVEAYSAADKAITGADVLPSQVESLRAAAKRGEDVTPLIEAAKAVVAEFKTLSESAESTGHGRVVEGAADADYTVSRWKEAV